MKKSSTLNILSNLVHTTLTRGKYNKLLTFQRDALLRAAEQLWEMQGGLEYSAETKKRSYRPETMPERARETYARTLYGHSAQRRIDPVEYAEGFVRQTRSYEPRIKAILSAVGADYDETREYQIRDYIHRHPTDRVITTLDTVEKAVKKTEEILTKLERAHQRRRRQPINEATQRKWQKIRATIWALGPLEAEKNAQTLSRRYTRLIETAEAQKTAKEVVSPTAAPAFKKAKEQALTLEPVIITPKTSLEILTDIRNAALNDYTAIGLHIAAQKETIAGLQSSVDALEFSQLEIDDRRTELAGELLPLIAERQTLVTEIQQCKPDFTDSREQELITLQAVYKYLPETHDKLQETQDEAPAALSIKTDDIANYLDSTDGTLLVLAQETLVYRELHAKAQIERDTLQRQDLALDAQWRHLQKKNAADQKEVTTLATLFMTLKTEQRHLHTRHGQIVSQAAAGASNRASSTAAPSMVLSK